MIQSSKCYNITIADNIGNSLPYPTINRLEYPFLLFFEFIKCHISSNSISLIFPKFRGLLLCCLPLYPIHKDFLPFSAIFAYYSRCKFRGILEKIKGRKRHIVVDTEGHILISYLYSSRGQISLINLRKS